VKLGERSGADSTPRKTAYNRPPFAYARAEVPSKPKTWYNHEIIFAFMQLLIAIGVLAAAFVLIRIWTGAMNVRVVEEESLASVEQKHPFLPKLGAIAVSVIIAGTLLVLSLKYGKNTSLQSFTGSTAAIRTIVVFLGILGFGLFDHRLKESWHSINLIMDGDIDEITHALKNYFAAQRETSS
jgi:hypothetical protein